MSLAGVPSLGRPLFAAGGSCSLLRMIESLKQTPASLLELLWGYARRWHGPLISIYNLLNSEDERTKLPSTSRTKKTVLAVSRLIEFSATRRSAVRSGPVQSRDYPRPVVSTNDVVPYANTKDIVVLLSFSFKIPNYSRVP